MQDYDQRTSLYDLIIACACGNEQSGILAKELLRNQGICIEPRHMNIVNLNELNGADYGVRVLICLAGVHMWKKELGRQRNFGDILKVTGYIGDYLSGLFLGETEGWKKYVGYRGCKKRSHTWHSKCKYFGIAFNIKRELFGETRNIFK